MQVHIIYFSPTGSCRAVAQASAEYLSRISCRLHDITAPEARRNPLAFSGNDWVIVVFPVYAHDVPEAVSLYLSRLEGNHAFVTIIGAYGNVSAGIAVQNAARLLTLRRFRVVSAAELICRHSYNGPEVQLAADRPNEKDMRELKVFLYRSLKKATDPRSNVRLAPLKWKRGLLSKLTPPQKLLVQFALHEPKCERALCVSCGACAAACPVGAIRADLSIIPEKCIRCLACVAACKVLARKKKFRTPAGVWYLSIFGEGEKQPVFFL